MATVLGPVLVVGMPIGAVAARDAVPPAAVPSAPVLPAVAAAVPSLEPPPPGSAPAPGRVEVTCEPRAVCIATPPPGPDNAFTVVASGGKVEATLEAQTSGGEIPDCAGYAERSADWIQVRFTDPAAGATWSKYVTLTSRHPTTRAAAGQALRKTEICFAAPYPFRTARGFRLTGGPAGVADFSGVLAACRHSRGDPEGRGLPAPCVYRRKVDRTGAGWVPVLTFRIPAGEPDPRGRS